MGGMDGVCCEDGIGSGVTKGSGDGGRGGREDRYLYALVCFGCFGFEGGGNRSSSLSFKLLVLTMKVGSKGVSQKMRLMGE